MAMVQSTLATGLEGMIPTAIESEAITRFVNAYGNFASTATGNAVVLTPAGLALGKNAMSPVLVGISEAGQGLIKIPAAITAFWSAVCTGFATSFPTSIAATPPPHVGFSATFKSVADSNRENGLTLSSAAAAFASAMYTAAVTGGTVTLPGPAVGPIL